MATETVRDTMLDGTPRGATLFTLPFFAEATFSIQDSADVSGLAEGAYLVVDMADDLARSIAEQGGSGENEAHALRMLLGLVSASLVAIGRNVDPNFQWA